MVMEQNCEKTRIEIVARCRGNGDPADDAAVADHLARCADCRAEERTHGNLRALVASTLPREQSSLTVDRILGKESLRRPIAHRYWYLPPAAAAALLLAFAALALPTVNREQVAAESSSGERYLTNTAPVTVDAETLTLPGRGTVRTRRGTTLAFPSASSVRLSQGEIFCDIEPQTKSFSVITENARIRVLGTAFGVRIDPDGRTTVHVFRGSVKCFHLRRSLTLAAGETAVITPENGPAPARPDETPGPELRLTRSGPADIELAIERDSIIPITIPPLDNFSTYLSLNITDPSGKTVQIKLDRANLTVLESPSVQCGTALICATSRYRLRCSLRDEFLTKKGKYTISVVYTNSDPGRGMWTGIRESNREELLHE